MLLRPVAFCVALASAAVLPGCGDDGPTAAERGTCRTFHRFEASRQADEIQRLRDDLAEQAARSGNDELRAAAEEFESQLAKGQITAAGTAVGRLRDECERLGVQAARPSSD